MNLPIPSSNVNRAARKERHKRLKLISPLLNDWENIERNLSPSEKKIERSFFWRVTSLATLFFFLFSLIPQFFVTAEEFWTTPYQESFASLEDSYMPVVDEGVILNAPIPYTGENEDRTELTEIAYYTVKSGDTLFEIAKKFGVTRRTITDTNDIENPNLLRSGTVLKIIPVDGLVHTVKKGETLDKIVAKYEKDKISKVSKEEIIAQNGLDPEQLLKEGENLIIPGGKKPIPVVVAVRQNTGNTRGVPVKSSADWAPKTGQTFIWPTTGGITQYSRPGHVALDIATNGGATNYAAAAGTVTKAAYGWNGGYGNVVIIDHGNGYETLYGHNKDLYVSAGDYVSQGQPIGFMGRTGRVYGRTGIHLHFEIIRNGVKLNPLVFF